jgi:hypothetical protein
MIDHANIGASQVNISAKKGIPAAHFPAHTHPNRPNTPNTVTQAVLVPPAPRIPTPIAKANGMVKTIVNNPHGLSANARTTTSANTAINIVMIPNNPTTAKVPATGPTSSRNICPTDFPLLRTLSHKIMLSCTAPPKTAPIKIQRNPGK